MSVLIERSITLCNEVRLLVLSTQINNMIVIKVHYAIFRLTIRGLDESEVVDLRIDTERRDKTDVRTFRRLDRTETAIVRIVYVTYLETCALTT